MPENKAGSPTTKRGVRGKSSGLPRNRGGGTTRGKGKDPNCKSNLAIAKREQKKQIQEMTLTTEQMKAALATKDQQIQALQAKRLAGRGQGRDWSQDDQVIQNNMFQIKELIKQFAAEWAVRGQLTPIAQGPAAGMLKDLLEGANPCCKPGLSRHSQEKLLWLSAGPRYLVETILAHFVVIAFLKAPFHFLSNKGNNYAGFDDTHVHAMMSKMQDTSTEARLWQSLTLRLWYPLKEHNDSITEPIESDPFASTRDDVYETCVNRALDPASYILPHLLRRLNEGEDENLRYEFRRILHAAGKLTLQLWLADISVEVLKERTASGQLVYETGDKELELHTALVNDDGRADASIDGKAIDLITFPGLRITRHDRDETRQKTLIACKAEALIFLEERWLPNKQKAEAARQCNNGFQQHTPQQKPADVIIEQDPVVNTQASNDVMEIKHSNTSQSTEEAKHGTTEDAKRFQAADMGAHTDSTAADERLAEQYRQSTESASRYSARGRSSEYGDQVGRGDSCPGTTASADHKLEARSRAPSPGVLPTHNAAISRGHAAGRVSASVRLNPGANKSHFAIPEPAVKQPNKSIAEQDDPWHEAAQRHVRERLTAAAQEVQTMPPAGEVPGIAASLGTTEPQADAKNEQPASEAPPERTTEPGPQPSPSLIEHNDEVINVHGPESTTDPGQYPDIISLEPQTIASIEGTEQLAEEQKETDGRAEAQASTRLGEDSLHDMTNKVVGFDTLFEECSKYNASANKQTDSPTSPIPLPADTTTQPQALPMSPDSSASAIICDGDALLADDHASVTETGE
ncbi:hypothetical protein LTR66_015215, partial [Elasticomyces elasticus]